MNFGSATISVALVAYHSLTKTQVILVISIYITFSFLDFEMLLPIQRPFCFLKVTYKYYMPMFRVDDAKLLNFNTISKNLHGSMRHFTQQIDSSYNDISPEL